MSNDVDREFVLDMMEVLLRSKRNKNGLYIENILYPMVMKNLNLLHDLRDLISEQYFSDIHLSGVK